MHIAPKRYIHDFSIADTSAFEFENTLQNTVHQSCVKLSYRDTLTGAVLYEFIGHEAEIGRMALSMDGALLVTVSIGDKSLRLWNALDGSLLDVLALSDEFVSHRAWFGFNPDVTRFLWSNPVWQSAARYEWPIKNQRFGTPEEVSARDLANYRCDGAMVGMDEGIFVWTSPNDVMIIRLPSGDRHRIWSPNRCSLLSFNPDRFHCDYGIY